MLRASMMSKNRVRKKFKSIISIVSLLLIGTSILTHEQVLLATGNFLVIKDDLQPADVTYVIAGDEHRTDCTIKLYKQDHSKQTFFTGCWSEEHNEYYGKCGKKAMNKQPRPEDVVLIKPPERGRKLAPIEGKLELSSGFF